jgi:lipopolysaccharide export system permease protein
MSSAAIRATGRPPQGSFIPAFRLPAWRKPVWWPSIVDLYILRPMLGWYASVVAIMVALLWLEILPRLVDQLGKVESGAQLVLATLVALVPEYLSIGIPLAVFLGTALAFRRLALAGEIDVLAGAGLSDRRLLRWPVIVALASCLLLIGLRGYWQPAGERRIDAIGWAVANGDYGFGLEAGVPHVFGPHASVYFDRIGPGRVLEGIFVEQGPTIATARTARIGLAPGGQAVIRMEDGAVTTQMPDRTTQAVHFHNLLLALTMPGQTPVKRQSHRTQLDRYALPDLLDLPPRARAAGLTSPMATAAASGRVATILFCALMPLLAFALAIPPKRSRSSIGLGLGIGLIVLFWKAAALVEDTAVATAPCFHAGLLLAFAAAIVWLLRRQYRLGHGANEAALDRSLGGAARRVAAWFGRWRR